MSPRDYISLKVVGRSALYFLSGIFLSDRLCVPLHFCSLEQSKTVICCLTTLFLFTFYCQSLDCNIEGYYQLLRKLSHILDERTVLRIFLERDLEHLLDNQLKEISNGEVDKYDTIMYKKSPGLGKHIEKWVKNRI